jgi:hypothetical protein
VVKTVALTDGASTAKSVRDVQLLFNSHGAMSSMREYGVLVARQIRGTGARIDVWDLGNENEVGVAGVAIRPSIESPHYQPPDAMDPEIGRMSTRQL